MALVQKIYFKEGCPFPTCLEGKVVLSVGEEFKIELLPKNSTWAESFVAEVVVVNPHPDQNGWLYTIEYDETEALGANMVDFDSCDIKSVEPYCCCDKLSDKVDELSGSLVVTDNITYVQNPDGSITATDSNGVVVATIPPGSGFTVNTTGQLVDSDGNVVSSPTQESIVSTQIINGEEVTIINGVVVSTQPLIVGLFGTPAPTV